jgi:hypothetical protein
MAPALHNLSAVHFLYYLPGYVLFCFAQMIRGGAAVCVDRRPMAIDCLFEVPAARRAAKQGRLDRAQACSQCL